MNSRKLTILTLCVLVLIASCKNRDKEKLKGIWKLNVMEINNTPIRGASLGNWLWEFNEEGGYLVNVAGATEKGIYKLGEDKLTLTPVTSQHPPQDYKIVKLDSISLNLLASSAQNKTELYFVKIKKREVGEND